MIVIEYDPLHCEDAQGMIEYVSQGLHDAAKDAAVLPYAPGIDTFLDYMTRNADRIFYFDEGPRATTKLSRKLIQKRRRARTPWRLGHDQIVVET